MDKFNLLLLYIKYTRSFVLFLILSKYLCTCGKVYVMQLFYLSDTVFRKSGQCKKHVQVLAPRWATLSPYITIIINDFSRFLFERAFILFLLVFSMTAAAFDSCSLSHSLQWTLICTLLKGFSYLYAESAVCMFHASAQTKKEVQQFAAR